MRLQQEEFVNDDRMQPSQDGKGRPSRSRSSASATTLPFTARVPAPSLERQTSSPPTAVTCLTSGTEGGRIPRAAIKVSSIGGGLTTATSPRAGQAALQVIEAERRTA